MSHSATPAIDEPRLGTRRVGRRRVPRHVVVAPPRMAGARREAAGERVTAHLRQNTPITVIRLLTDTLRKEDVAVEADLTTGVATPDRALADTLADRGGDRGVPLTAVGVGSAFVPVTGLFTARRASDGDIVLSARYGTADPAARGRITCEAAGVREGFQNAEYVTGQFQARCLGRVPTWNRERGGLTLNPIAVLL
ncbi:hypothetical protein [Streptomyces sp. NPDC003522]